MNRTAVVAGTFVLAGVAGWTIENVVRGPTFSKAFNGARIPFLPVYAFGGAAAVLMMPVIAGKPAWLRFIAYGGVLTGVEAIAGAMDRIDGGRPSWDYNGLPVDLGYSLVWASAAMLVEQMAIAYAASK